MHVHNRLKHCSIEGVMCNLCTVTCIFEGNIFEMLYYCLGGSVGSNCNKGDVFNNSYCVGTFSYKLCSWYMINYSDMCL